MMPITGFLTQLKFKIQKFLPQPKPPDPNEFVTIATFLPVLRPHVDILRSGLEAEGIACIINGDWGTQADFVRIQVRRADVAQARAILEEMETS